MRKFWDPVVKPLLEAAGARRVVEIGSESGGHTQRLALWCRQHGAELDVVDPKPDFSPEQFAAMAPGARLHLALSLEVIHGLLPADVVLIDGDHNWHTVFHEVTACYGEAGPLPEGAPILVCHDVGWPYGRRDLYYDADTIPPSARRPSRTGPLSPASKGMVALGLNAILHHAETEGGPRNGVRTGIEDALAGRMDQVRIVWLNVLFGLAVIVPLARLEAAPELEALLADLEPSANWRRLAALVEQERLSGAIALQHMHGFQKPAATGAGGLRAFATSLPRTVLNQLHRGSVEYAYRGRPMLMNPLDMANYLALLGEAAPRTVFEIGAWRGGRALWLADMLSAQGGTPRVVSVDIRRCDDLDDPRISFLQGDAMALGEAIAPDLLALPHPWLVIEDSAHEYETSRAVLDFFHPHLVPGDRLVVEDGIAPALSDESRDCSSSGPSKALAEFVAERRADYAVDTASCDRFGYNATYSPNGWLIRI